MGLLGLTPGLAVRYEPLQRNVDIVLLLARDGIAADLSILHQNYITRYRYP